MDDLTTEEVEQLRMLLTKAKTAQSTSSTGDSGSTSGPTIVHHRAGGLATPSKFADGSITEWLERFEVCATANGWTPATKLTQIPTFLEGRAFAIYKELPNLANLSFNEVRQALVDRFLPPESRSARYGEFQMAKILPTESTEAFTYRLEQLLSVAIPDLDGSARTEILKHQFIKGMPAMISTRLLENPTYTYPQCVVAARQLLAVHRDGISTASGSRSKDAAPATLSMAGHGHIEDSHAKSGFDVRNSNRSFDRPRTGFQRRSSEVRSCYNCGQAGHIAKNCRRSKQTSPQHDDPCQICQQPGHTAVRCDRRYERPSTHQMSSSKSGPESPERSRDGCL